MTFLELVNKVLIRLREDTVSSVSQNDYSTMIGEFVNQAKNLVEDRWLWQALKNKETITTASGTYEYTLSVADRKIQPLQMFLPDKKLELVQSNLPYIRHGIEIEQLQSVPTKYVISGQDSSGNINVWLYPIPDDTYTIDFYYFADQPELTNDNDRLIVPALPVILAATALALEERGEDTGQSPNTLWAQYEQSIGAAIIRDVESTVDNYSFDAGQLI